MRGAVPSLPHLEPVVAHGQVEDIIPLLLFAPLGQQFWWGGGEMGVRKESENRISLLLVSNPHSHLTPPALGHHGHQLPHFLMVKSG